MIWVAGLWDMPGAGVHRFHADGRIDLVANSSEGETPTPKQGTCKRNSSFREFERNGSHMGHWRLDFPQPEAPLQKI